MELQGQGQLCPLSHWKRQPTSLAACSTAMFPTNAENVGGMQKPGSMLPWSVCMARILRGGGNLGADG